MNFRIHHMAPLLSVLLFLLLCWLLLRWEPKLLCSLILLWDLVLWFLPFIPFMLEVIVSSLVFAVGAKWHIFTFYIVMCIHGTTTCANGAVPISWIMFQPCWRSHKSWRRWHSFCQWNFWSHRGPPGTHPLHCPSLQLNCISLHFHCVHSRGTCHGLGLISTTWRLHLWIRRLCPWPRSTLKARGLWLGLWGVLKHLLWSCISKASKFCVVSLSQFLHVPSDA